MKSHLLTFKVDLNHYECLLCGERESDILVAPCEETNLDEVIETLAACDWENEMYLSSRPRWSDASADAKSTALGIARKVLEMLRNGNGYQAG